MIDLRSYFESPSSSVGHMTEPLRNIWNEEKISNSRISFLQARVTSEKKMQKMSRQTDRRSRRSRRNRDDTESQLVCSYLSYKKALKSVWQKNYFCNINPHLLAGNFIIGPHFRQSGLSCNSTNFEKKSSGKECRKKRKNKPQIFSRKKEQTKQLYAHATTQAA